MSLMFICNSIVKIIHGDKSRVIVTKELVFRKKRSDANKKTVNAKLVVPIKSIQ